MTAPRFSVVIPTRERPRTLAFALATCLDQEFDDYEIVVCDNGASAATRQVIDAAGSVRVRYVKAPRPLAMSDNWELAVAQARGEFIIVLGDDDGLMPYALREIDRLLIRFGSRLVRWTAAFYTWPDIALPGQGNYLALPMERGVRVVDARATIAAVVRFEAPYVLLPMLYNSAVHRSLVDEVRHHAGRVFPNRYPDVYTGLALGYLAGRYPSTDVPMSIAGASGASSGIANLFLRGRSRLDEDFRRLNDEARLPTHPWVPDLPVFPEVPVADSFQMAKEALFPADDALSLDRRRLLAHCLSAIPASSDGVDETATIRASAADDPALLEWLETTLAADVIVRRPPIKVRPDRLGFDGQRLHLDAAQFGVENVGQAVDLVERVLKFRGRDIEYREDPITG